MCYHMWSVKVQSKGEDFMWEHKNIYWKEKDFYLWLRNVGVLHFALSLFLMSEVKNKQILSKSG